MPGTAKAKKLFLLSLPSCPHPTPLEDIMLQKLAEQGGPVSICPSHNIPEAYGETSSCPSLKKGWQPPQHSVSPQISLSRPFMLQRPSLKHCSGRPHLARTAPPHCLTLSDMPHAQEPAGGNIGHP